MVSDPTHGLQAYVDLTSAFVEMERYADALETIEEGLERYASDETLLKLREQVRHRMAEPPR
jgi:hypothetical protein